MPASLKKILQSFKILRVDRPYGVAPHKPILLITVLKGFQKQLIVNSKINISTKIVTISNAIWIKFISKNNAEEIYLSESLFKRKTIQIFNNNCCIQGMINFATISIAIVNPCNIIPISKSYNYICINVIALCLNLPRAFERGAIAIENLYKVLVLNIFKEDESNYSNGSIDRKLIH